LINVHCLYDLLKRDAPKGLVVKSLNIIPFPEDASPEVCASFKELWGQLEIAVGRDVTENEAEWIILGFVLEKCRKLQTLNLLGSIFCFPLTEQKGVPFHLRHTL